MEIHFFNLSRLPIGTNDRPGIEFATGTSDLCFEYDDLLDTRGPPVTHSDAVSLHLLSMVLGMITHFQRQINDNLSEGAKYFKTKLLQYVLLNGDRYSYETSDIFILKLAKNLI